MVIIVPVTWFDISVIIETIPYCNNVVVGADYVRLVLFTVLSTFLITFILHCLVKSLKGPILVLCNSLAFASSFRLLFRVPKEG